MTKYFFKGTINQYVEKKGFLYFSKKISMWAIALCAVFFFSADVLLAQVSSSPAFPSRFNSVTIFFDATKGNQELLDFSGDVYIHTGLITDKSNPENPPDPINNPGDWKYIKTAFGQNTSATKMNKLGANLYSLTISDLEDYYGAESSDELLKIAMIFRSGDSEKVAKEENGDDFFIELFSDGVYVRFNTPSSESVFLESDESLDIQVLGAALGSTFQAIELFENDTKLTETTSDTLNYVLTPGSSGRKKLTAIAINNEGERDSATIHYLVPDAINESPRPVGVTEGITYYESDPAKVTLSLLAPFKKHVYVIGEFNNWQILPEYQMNRETVSSNEVYWWVDITGLTPGQQYAFQYLVDNEIRIADPYSEEVLHPDDNFIQESTYPDLKTYPYGKTTEYVSIIETDKEEFNWTDQSWSPPPKENLVIYELLVRDFSAKHDFQTVIDSLDYLQRMGINAIELMPVNEFEGNNSWGYNPSFYFATDRYYGHAEDLKKLINESHNRGIAIILDAVYNHSFGQSPMVRLYNEGEYGKPTSENIWFNTEARHPFNVGYDFDHSSRFTQQFIDSVNRFWVREFHVDGFRYDLSKGFTQNFTSDVGGWNQYDQSRVDLLNRMKSKIHEVYPETYLILEHLGNNDEEKVLSNSGFMLWGIMHDQYKDAALGFNGDLTNVSYQNRGWNNPHLVGYMESHDEERIMHEIENFGNAVSGYDTKQKTTALNRIKIANAFLLSVPGPKMFWQFGEYGYDISINQNGRTGEKPILWSYLDDADRYRLYQTTSELAKLKTTHPSFATTDFSLDMGGKQKRILLRSGTDVQILGNFDVISADVYPYGHNSGSGKWWFEYFSGDSLLINESSVPAINMKPGEFRIYSTSKLGTPPPGILNEKAGQIALESPKIEFKEFSGGEPDPSFKKRFTITNTGSGSITITDISNFSSEFSVSPKSAFIGSGSTLDLEITFEPSGLGNFEDTFTIETSGIGTVKFQAFGSYEDALPGIPVLLNPMDDSKDVPLNTVFDWQEVSNAESYEIEIRNVESDLIVETESGLGDNRFVASELTLEKEYRWRVRSENSFGVGEWSSYFTFTTLPQVPGAIELASPANEAIDISTSPVLIWNENIASDFYEIHVATNSSFTANLSAKTDVKNSSTQFVGLSANSEYYWRVRGVNISGNGEWSEIRSFVTSSVGTPDLVSPINNNANTALDADLIWNRAANAETYTIQVSKEPDFKIRAEQTEISDTLFTPDFLERNAKYYWRVRSKSSTFESAWSAIGIFSTPFDAPVTPTLISPANNAIDVEDVVLFDWSKTELTGYYQIQVSANSEFSMIAIDSTEILENDIEIKNSLNRNTSYFWRVRAINSSDSSAWSDTFRFSTLPEIPQATILISPADSLTELSGDILFKWQKADINSEYRFQLSANKNFYEKRDTLIKADTSFTVAELEFDQTYYWRVQTINKGGSSPWSETRLFKTQTDFPGIPVLITPQANISVDSKKNRFVWTQADRASTYRFQLSNSAVFEDVFIDSTNLIKQELENISLPENARLFWRVQAKNKAGSGGWSAIQQIKTSIATSIETDNMPKNYALDQNYPNPFNPSTTINYALPKSEKVTITVFNMIGQKVATLINKKQEAGFHSVNFEASNLASGMYIYRIKAGSFSQIKKLTLIK
jgi:1,4-alpha-glucan branching enzyme